MVNRSKNTTQRSFIKRQIPFHSPSSYVYKHTSSSSVSYIYRHTPSSQYVYRRTPSRSYSYKRPNSSSSSDSPRLCEICFENKLKSQMFRVRNCSHSYCSGCITKYISSKVEEKVAVVTCPTPGCKGVFDYDTCRIVIPKEVAERWDKVLAESLIPESQKFYCPFKDCSALMVREAGMEDIREAECMVCRRLFCAECRSPWHFDRSCKDGTGREDLVFKKLAKLKNWANCPQCKFYVERISGCAHMVCRCKYEFCYRCGKHWSVLHSCR